jgi:ubiquinone/menaquinone biosynthesis C-methylase UbiE
VTPLPQTGRVPSAEVGQGRPAKVDLRVRTTEPELLDLGVDDAEASRSLADLRLVNRLLGVQRTLAEAVLPHLRPGARLLDVGCGSADLPAFLGRQAPSPVLLVGLDRKILHLREASGVVRGVQGDVHALPFRKRSFDVVTATHFLHHFDTPEVSGLLRALFDLSRGVLVVNDLHRARVPYLFSRMVFPLVFKSAVSVHDGLVSIRRGFRPAELEDAFRAAGITRVSVVRRFPYRLIAVAEA